MDFQISPETPSFSRVVVLNSVYRNQTGSAFRSRKCRPSYSSSLCTTGVCGKVNGVDDFLVTYLNLLPWTSNESILSVRNRLNQSNGSEWNDKPGTVNDPKG